MHSLQISRSLIQFPSIFSGFLTLRFYNNEIVNLIAIRYGVSYTTGYILQGCYRNIWNYGGNESYSKLEAMAHLNPEIFL